MVMKPKLFYWGQNESQIPYQDSYHGSEALSLTHVLAAPPAMERQSVPTNLRRQNEYKKKASFYMSLEPLTEEEIG